MPEEKLVRPSWGRLTREARNELWDDLAEKHGSNINILRKFGDRALKAMHEHGLDAVHAIDQHGAPAVEAISLYGGNAARIMRWHGGRALEVINKLPLTQRGTAFQLVSKYDKIGTGSHVLNAIDLHGKRAIDGFEVGGRLFYEAFKRHPQEAGELVARARETEMKGLLRELNKRGPLVSQALKQRQQRSA